ncbi:MAG: hypothetical protein IJU76_05160 [Desulfovibrionaceae bacterium]|nr:hypothetical protein [Desulfovibrionaceae bacterium]
MSLGGIVAKAGIVEALAFFFTSMVQYSADDASVKSGCESGETDDERKPLVTNTRQ